MRQIPCSRTPHKLLRWQAARKMFSSGRKELFKRHFDEILTGQFAQK
jgi:hypothetical protein